MGDGDESNPQGCKEMSGTKIRPKNGCPGYIRAALNRLEEAAIADAFKGSRDPEDHELIEAEYRLQRYRVELMIDRALKRAAGSVPPS